MISMDGCSWRSSGLKERWLLGPRSRLSDEWDLETLNMVYLYTSRVYGASFDVFLLLWT